MQYSISSSVFIMLIKTFVLLCCAIVSASSHAIERRPGGVPVSFSNLRPVSHPADVPVSFSNLRPVSQPSSHEMDIMNAIQELALDISASYWEKGHTGNVVQSPVSLSSLLSLLLLGSRGDTYSELKRALHYSDDITDIDVHETYKKILDNALQKNSGVEISLSSRLFMQEGLPIMRDFTEMAEQSYGSSVRGLNFKEAPVIAMNNINRWVETETHGKIKDLIATPFSTDTKFVAANVIYFNGNWENQFSKKITSTGTFDTGSRNVSIPMMTTLMDVPYLKGDQIGFDMISLPYVGGKYSMLILTPHGKAGIQSLTRMEYHLDSRFLNNLVRLMKTTRVSVTIPRMKLSHKMYLKSNLESLHVNSMFSASKADFGRLTTQPGIFVNDIVHEATIEITETGTVAAAASAATFDRFGGNEIFRMDKPSILLIRDNTSALTLFWARVMEPEPIYN